MEHLKKCCTCLEEKELSCFSRSAVTQDGLERRCKACTSKAVRRHYFRNHEAKKNYQRQRRTQTKLLIASPEQIAKRKWNNIEGNRRRAFLITHAKQDNYLFKILEWCRDNFFTCDECKGVFHIKNLSIDHIIPLCQGGNDTSDNVRPVCGKCNSIKGADKPKPKPEELIKRQGGKNKLFFGPLNKTA